MRPIHAGLGLLGFGMALEAPNLENRHSPCLKLLPDGPSHCWGAPTSYWNPTPCMVVNSHSLKPGQPKAICHPLNAMSFSHFQPTVPTATS